MIDTFGWGGWLTGCLAVIVIVASIAAVRYLLLCSSDTDDNGVESGRA